MAIAVLPQENVVYWMMKFGASGSSDIERFVAGNSSFDGIFRASHALIEVVRSEVLGMNSESRLGVFAVMNETPMSFEELYVTHMR